MKQFNDFFFVHQDCLIIGSKITSDHSTGNPWRTCVHLFFQLLNEPMELNKAESTSILCDESVNELFCAWNALNIRGLVHASKFIAELMVSLRAKPTVSCPMINDPTYLLAKNYFDIKVFIQRLIHAHN
jgi:hypothetical protein